MCPGKGSSRSHLSLLGLKSQDIWEMRSVTAAGHENVCYQRGALFPCAHVVVCLICLWVEVGRGEGSVQSVATAESHEVIGAKGSPHWPLAASVLLACIPRGSPLLPQKVLVSGLLLWTYI